MGVAGSVVGGGGHGVGQGPDGVEFLGGDPGGRPLGRLAGQRAQDGEVVEDVAGGEADDRDPAAGGHLDEPLVGQLQQRLPDRRAAGAELGADGVEVEAGAGGEGAGQDPVAELLGGPAPHRPAHFDPPTPG